MPLFKVIPDGSVRKESACNAGDPGQSLVGEDPLEMGIATHTNILAWRIPWTQKASIHKVTKNWT